MALKISIIGAGGIGSYYARLVELLEGVELAYVCDVDEAKARAVAGEVCCRYTTRLEEAVEGCDAVLIATPPFARLDAVRVAVEAGRPVFCEKPLARSLGEAREIERLARGRVPFMVGFTLRWWPVYERLKELLERGELGEPAMLWLTDMTYWSDTLRRAPWRRRGELSTGIFEQLVHELDIARYLLGEVEEVYAHGARRVLEEVDYEDCVAVTFKFRSGAVGCVAGSVASRLWHRRGLLVCSRAAAYFDTGEQSLRIASAEGERSEKLGWRGDPYLMELKEFVRWVEEGVEARATLEDGVKAQELVEAAIKSLREGRPVKLPL